MDKKFTIKEILEDYHRPASKQEEHEMVLWGSKQSMLNRFLLAAETVRWEHAEKWIDIGSGTGTFLQIIEEEHEIGSYTGIDLSPSLIDYAKKKRYKTKHVTYLCQNFMDPIDGEPADLVTAIGVLQKCGVELPHAFKRFNQLLSLKGQLFITTKNADWRAFKEQQLIPYEGHHWFSLTDIQTALTNNGFEVLELNGILPQTKEVVAPEDSHSIYVHAIKREQV